MCIPVRKPINTVFKIIVTLTLSRYYEKISRENYVVITRKDLIITRKDLVITRKLSRNSEKIMSQRGFSEPKLCTLL